MSPGWRLYNAVSATLPPFYFQQLTSILFLMLSTNIEIFVTV